MQNLERLPEATRLVFEHLARNLRDFTLIGGTALALQVGHRYSESLVFWLPSQKLNRHEIAYIVRTAENAGFRVSKVTLSSLILQARLNGVDFNNYLQDWAFDGVKVTFFARCDLPFQHFNEFPRVLDSDVSFPIMGIDGILAMKSYVIHQRVQSRDLFDLKVLMENGKSLDDLLKAAVLADPSCSPDYAKRVLSGNIPLDFADAGFETTGDVETIESIHEFFRDAIQDYERSTTPQLSL
jgi:hypothetical protein